MVTNPWLKYQLETGDYDATVEDRETFMIGVQGPNALRVVEKMIDGKLANYRRRGLEQVEVDGVSVRTIGHYHPPPNASSDDDDVDASCITVRELVLVARAVHQLWRGGYDSGTVDPLDDATNPS